MILTETVTATTIDTATPTTFTCSQCPFARLIEDNRYCCQVSQTASDVKRGHWEATVSCFEALTKAEAEKVAEVAEAPLVQTVAPEPEPEPTTTTGQKLMTNGSTIEMWPTTKAAEILAAQKIIKIYPVAGDGVQAPGSVVLRRFGEQWATHFYNEQDGGFHYGRYFSNLPDAEQDFARRVSNYAPTTTN